MVINDNQIEATKNCYHVTQEGGKFAFTLYNRENNNRPMCITLHALKDSNTMRSVLQTNGYTEL